MTNPSRTYLPGAGHDWFLPLYDPMVKLLGGDAVHQALLEQAGMRSGLRVLDVGCGTGTLAVAIKHLHADVEVVGLDPDPKALERARGKAARAKVSIRFDQGFADELPYPEGSFDRVLSSLMFHHLPAREKGKFLQAVRRVLKSGGSFHMLDFERTGGGGHGLLARLLHSSHPPQDSSESRILFHLREAGFANPERVARRRMLVASVGYYRAGTAN